MIDTLAGYQNTHAHTLASHAKAMQIAYASADVGLWLAECTAGNTWYSDVTAAEATFRGADYADQGTAVTGLAAGMGDIPWAAFQAELAGTRSTWWNGHEQAHHDLASDVNAEYSRF